MIDTQVVTLAEAAVLLLSNAAGALLAALAWRVSDVDVREARRWQPAAVDPAERARVRHNRLVVTEDARYGESRRFAAHVMIGVVGVFWLLTPQPVNPAVVWWAVGIRGVVLGLSLVLIDKSAHHLVARYRFDKPWLADRRWGLLPPALRLAWRDIREPS